MKTTDFNSKLTSSKLKENIEKQFGANVNLTKYSREQLEDIRNKLRTKIFQQEGTSKLNDLLTNETYQKNKAMLELLNTRIKEMLGEDIKKLRDKMTELSEAKKGVKAPKFVKKAKGTHADRDYDGDGNIESGKDEYLGSKIAAAKKAGKMKEGTMCKKCDCDPCECDDVKEGKGKKPDFLDMDKDGNKKEPMKKAVADKKGGPKKGVNPFAKVKEGSRPVTGSAHDKLVGAISSRMSDTPQPRRAPKDDAEAASWARMDQDKKAMQASREKKANEGFPTVDDAKKNAAGTAGMKTGEKKKSSTGGEITKTATGLKHAAGKNYGGKDAPKAPDSDKKSMKSMKESMYKHNVRFVNESLAFLLQEDEEGKAKAITAAGDMVNDYTSWMQRVGQYQTKTMIELADAIKADFGAQEAEAFKAAVGPALSATLEVLTQQREAVSNAVAALAGEATPDMGMGMEPGMDQGMPADGMDMAAPDEMNPAMGGDEFGAADAAAGDGTTGRAMRESRRDRITRKLAESHSIMAKLSR